MDVLLQVFVFVFVFGLGLVSAVQRHAALGKRSFPH